MSTLRVNNVTDLGDDAVVTSGVLDTLAVPAGGILQVVSTSTTTTIVTTSTSYTDANLTLSITPQSTSSKIFVISMFTCDATRTDGNAATARPTFRILRDSTEVTSTDYFIQQVGGGTTVFVKDVGLTGLDSPQSTSELTYKLQHRVYNGTLTTHRSPYPGNLILMEVAG